MPHHDQSAIRLQIKASRIKLSCNGAADAVRFTAKQRNRFLLLVNNFDVVNTGLPALMTDLRSRGLRCLRQKHGRKEINRAGRSDGCQPLAIAGVGKGGISQ